VIATRMSPTSLLPPTPAVCGRSVCSLRDVVAALATVARGRVVDSATGTSADGDSDGDGDYGSGNSRKGSSMEDVVQVLLGEGMRLATGT